MPGRVWAFRRPAWVPDVSRDARMPRAAAALRAGLSTAIAFPLAVGDECLGVIEFFTGGVHEHNGEVSAMFATVGGQLAQYLARHAAERDRDARVPRPRGRADRGARRRRPRAAGQRPRLRGGRAARRPSWSAATGRRDPRPTWLSTPLDGGGALLLGQTAAVAV